MYGPSPFMSQLMGLFCSMDKMVGQKFEEGSARLNRLPAAGLKQERVAPKGWSLMVDSEAIPMLSPVDGEVVAATSGRIWRRRIC